MSDNEPDIIIPSSLARAVRMLDARVERHRALVIARDSITHHACLCDECHDDLDDTIETTRAEILVLKDCIRAECNGQQHAPMFRVLNAEELHARKCRCGARVLIEGENQ